MNIEYRTRNTECRNKNLIARMLTPEGNFIIRYSIFLRQLNSRWVRSSDLTGNYRHTQIPHGLWHHDCRYSITYGMFTVKQKGDGLGKQTKHL